MHLLLWQIRTRQMHHGLDTNKVLRRATNLERLVGGGAAGAPRDVNPRGLNLAHPVEALEQILLAFLGFRRKEFEREQQALLLDGSANLVQNLHRLTST